MADSSLLQMVAPLEVPKLTGTVSVSASSNIVSSAGPKQKTKKPKRQTVKQIAASSTSTLTEQSSSSCATEDNQESQTTQLDTSGEEWQKLVNYHKSLADGHQSTIAPPSIVTLSQSVEGTASSEVPLMPDTENPPSSLSPGTRTANTQLCRMCNKSFQQWHHLKRHLLSHTDYRPYACEICGKRFQIQNKLKRHEAIHNGSKPYSCALCDVKVSRMEHLRRHLLTHSEAKPYRCSQCDHTARRADSIRTHIRKTHKEQATVLRVVSVGQDAQGSTKPILIQPQPVGQEAGSIKKEKPKKKKVPTATLR